MEPNLRIVYEFGLRFSESENSPASRAFHFQHVVFPGR
jgi:hypothetical protein